MSRILVSGASGFLGKALVPALKHAGHNVTGVIGDVTLAASWEAAPDCDTVIHLAAKTFVPESWENSAEFLRVNVVGTEQALSYCRKYGARLIFPSTYVYGAPQYLPVDEAHPVQPNNPYTLSKVLAEQLCEFSAANHSVSTTILRLFNIYGPGQKEDFLIPKIAGQIARQQPIHVADLTPKRDYIYIKDVVQAFLLALDAPAGLHKLNICSGLSQSVADVIEALQTAARSNLTVSEDGKRRPGEVMDLYGSYTKAQALLGWHPRWPLADGLTDMLSAYKVAA